MEMFHECKLLSSSVKELLLACPPSLRFTSKELSLGELQGYLVYEVSQKEFYIQLVFPFFTPPCILKIKSNSDTFLKRHSN